METNFSIFQCVFQKVLVERIFSLESQDLSSGFNSDVCQQCDHDQSSSLIALSLTFFICEMKGVG